MDDGDETDTDGDEDDETDEVSEIGEDDEVFDDIVKGTGNVSDTSTSDEPRSASITRPGSTDSDTSVCLIFISISSFIAISDIRTILTL